MCISINSQGLTSDANTVRITGSERGLGENLVKNSPTQKNFIEPVSMNALTFTPVKLLRVRGCESNNPMEKTKEKTMGCPSAQPFTKASF